jgi:uncharacterized membrane protein
MPQNVNDMLQLFLRWGHVVAGILWIGHLYFFNFVNAHFAKALDGPTKKITVPELMPRALFWFRWGAAWTWLTGILLGGLVYYHSKLVFDDPTDTSNNPWLWLAIVLVILAVGFVIYNLVMKSVKNVVAANTIVLVLFLAVYLFLEYAGKFGGRSLYIHAGLIFGTIMALNVWMRILPPQRRMIAAAGRGEHFDDTLAAGAKQRSKHNTFLASPTTFIMISNHFPTATYGNDHAVAVLGALILVGWVAAGLLRRA